MERLTYKLKKPTQNGFEYVGINGASAQKVLKKLGELEDLEERGLLLKLPCKVGDVVYGFQFPRTDMAVVSREKVERIAIETNDALYDLEDFGEEFFLTKAEAEKALEEMEK